MIKKIKNKISNKYREFVDTVLPGYCYKSRFLSSLYYFAFSSAFRRECRAVLAGKVKHLEDIKVQKANFYLLVRNTHRIEKGLLMRPMKKVFAMDYISETVDSYSGFVKNGDISHAKQLKWFTDVLSTYFDTVAPSGMIAIEKEKFLKSKKLLNGEIREVSSIPYLREENKMTSISYEQFFALNRQRRSVRWFKNQPVERDKIDKAILVALQAPSACNRQPFEYRVFDDPELVKKVVDFPMGTKGYAHSIQTFIVVVGNLDAYFSERDRHLIYVDASLANMALMLALETLGLSSCPINWPDIESREIMMENFLSLSTHQRPIMCIGVGYPDFTGKVAFSEKRNLNQTRKFN
ncbi:nitroreductase family protein [Negadavirga shengliensis]|uniref:Nitroreductase family protein n=1 Tax=Negadavirga shengliensis TaxID=1389218 RepID=A0ABV9T2B2_9BACT